MKIQRVFAREILDSRGNPTVECSVQTAKGVFCASVPSGASTGRHEAVERRDGGRRYGGKGVQRAVASVNATIRRALAKSRPRTQEHVDALLISLDGTPDKRRLGANALLATSLAFARAAAAENELALYAYVARLARATPVLPIPFANLVNGGLHAGNGLAFQEFMVVPRGLRPFSERVRAVSEIYHALGAQLVKKHGRAAVNVGDEGGFAPPLSRARDALDALERAVSEAGYAKRVSLALDCAASSFWKGGAYGVDGRKLAPGAYADFLHGLRRDYALFSVEDPFHEEAFDAFAAFTAGARGSLVVGDDLLTTNPARIRRAADARACNALLLKPNQIGTLSEALAAFRLARHAGWETIASHRSGETTDAFLAHLAVGLGCGFAKIGAPARGERTAKYNALLRIEEALA